MPLKPLPPYDFKSPIIPFSELHLYGVYKDRDRVYIGGKIQDEAYVGQKCLLLKTWRGRGPHNVEVQFADGHLMICPARCTRKIVYKILVCKRCHREIMPGPMRICPKCRTPKEQKRFERLLAQIYGKVK